MDSGQVKEIRNAVVKRCHSCGDAVHVYVDKRSTYVSYLVTIHVYMYNLSKNTTTL